MNVISANNLIKVFSFPTLLYVIFLITRIHGFQPSMEGELGDFITSLNFLFGSFVSYFIFVFFIVTPQNISRYRSLWWWLMCMLLSLLAFDELFMIHENLSGHLDIDDIFIFLVYGLILGVLLMFNLKETFTKNTFMFLTLFAFFSVISQVSDFLYNEGTIILMNREISYEQFSESFGALCLSCAIVTIAIRQVMKKESPLDIAR